MTSIIFQNILVNDCLKYFGLSNIKKKESLIVIN